MLATFHACRLLVLVALLAAPLRAQDRKLFLDQLEMSDGRSLRGLILKNTADTVLLQTSAGEIAVPKSDIRRIREEADRDIYLSQVTARGKLPSWNAIVHDFRDHDAVWRLEIIPSAAITTGEFRNIPYLSFVVNKQAKLNILGDPADPVGVQFAIFGKKGRSAKYHQIVREFLAGHLHTRQEIATLYSLSPRGDRKEAGRLAFLVTPPESPDAHGAWALTIYAPSRLAAARVSEGKYTSMTRPFDAIHRRDGTINPAVAQRLDQWLVSSVMSLPSQIPKIRGFERDRRGSLQVLRLDPSP